MQRVDQLLVWLGADAAPLRKALKESERELLRAQRSMSRSTKVIDADIRLVTKSAAGMATTMARFAGPALGGFLAVATWRGFTDGVRGAVAELDNVAKTANRIGLTTSALQELRHAADLSGVSVSTFDMAFQRFARRTAEARRGTGEAKDALKELGIEFTKANGTLKTNEELFLEVSDALSEVTVASDKTRLAFKLFDSEGVALINMLDQGAAEIERMRQEARDLGLVFDEALIKKATEAKDRLDTLYKIIDANVTVALAELAPLLQDIVEGLVDFIAWAKDAYQAMDRLAEESHVLEAALAGLIGLMLGGPLGAALGAGIGLLLSMYEETEKVRKSQELMKEALNGVEQAFQDLKQPNRDHLAMLRAQTREALKTAEAELALAQARNVAARAELDAIRGGTGFQGPGAEGMAMQTATAAEQRLKRAEAAVSSLLGRLAELKGALSGPDAEVITVPTVKTGGGGGGKGGSDKRRGDEIAELVQQMQRAVEVEALRTRAMREGEAAQQRFNAELTAYNQLLQVGLIDKATPVVEALEQMRAAEMGLADGMESVSGAVLAAQLELQRYAEQVAAIAEIQQEMADFQNELADDRSSSEAARIASELQKLEDWHNTRLEQLKEARDRELQTEEEFLKNRAALEESYNKRKRDLETARYGIMVGEAASSFGVITQMTRQFAGEQSGIYKALFAVQKAFSIADAIINTEQAVTKALAAYPPPFNFAMAALVGAKGAASVALIAAQGFAQGGLVRGPGTATSDSIPANLSDGEYVVRASAAANNLPLLEQINAGRMPALPAVPRMGSAMAAAGTSQPAQITVINEAGNLVRAEADPRQPNTVRVRELAREEVLAGAGDAAARDLRDPDSNFSKALGSLTTARRSR